jgi:glycosyltransferase involved in cell wall biosynthesis
MEVAVADDRLRILILNWKDLSHPAAGGAEVYTEGFARELAARGHHVTLFVGAVQGRAADEVVDGIRIVRRGGRLGVYREAKRFWREEGGRGRFDVVIDEVNTRPFLTPRYIHDTPIVALIHQVAKEVWKYEVPFPVGLVGRYFFEPRWLRTYRSTPVMTDSPSSAASLVPYGIRDAAPLPIGAAPIERPQVDKEAVPTIVFVARLVESKRPHHVLEAFREVRAAVPDAQLWMIGDGPYRARLEGAAVPGVQLLGRVSMREREERMARAHVLVAASVREGWGLTVSEAAAVGTPSIGYRAPGLVDSVPASGGHLVDEAPAALASALVDFFQGRLTITPTSTLVPWSAVADAVEGHLRRAIAAHHR